MYRDWIVSFGNCFRNIRDDLLLTKIIYGIYNTRILITYQTSHMFFETISIKLWHISISSRFDRKSSLQSQYVYLRISVAKRFGFLFSPWFFAPVEKTVISIRYSSGVEINHCCLDRAVSPCVGRRVEVKRAWQGNKLMFTCWATHTWWRTQEKGTQPFF